MRRVSTRRFDLGHKIDWIAVGVETAKKLHSVAAVTAKVIVRPIERLYLALALVTQHAECQRPSGRAALLGFRGAHGVGEPLRQHHLIADRIKVAWPIGPVPRRISRA